MPDMSVANSGFTPSNYPATASPTVATPVTFQAFGSTPPTHIWTYLSDETTPFSLFGGSGNTYPVPSDRTGTLYIPKGMAAGTYVVSPTQVVEKGTKGTINVTVGAK